MFGLVVCFISIVLSCWLEHIRRTMKKFKLKITGIDLYDSSEDREGRIEPRKWYELVFKFNTSDEDIERLVDASGEMSRKMKKVISDALHKLVEDHEAKENK